MKKSKKKSGAPRRDKPATEELFLEFYNAGVALYNHPGIDRELRTALRFTIAGLLNMYDFPTKIGF